MINENFEFEKKEDYIEFKLDNIINKSKSDVTNKGNVSYDIESKLDNIINKQKEKSEFKEDIFNEVEDIKEVITPVIKDFYNCNSEIDQKKLDDVIDKLDNITSILANNSKINNINDKLEEINKNSKNDIVIYKLDKIISNFDNDVCLNKVDDKLNNTLSKHTEKLQEISLKFDKLFSNEKTVSYNYEEIDKKLDNITISLNKNDNNLKILNKLDDIADFLNINNLELTTKTDKLISTFDEMHEITLKLNDIISKLEDDSKIKWFNSKLDYILASINKNNESWDLESVYNLMVKFDDVSDLLEKQVKTINKLDYIIDFLNKQEKVHVDYTKIISKLDLIIGSLDKNAETDNLI